jgi:hypothetical protein
MTAQQHLDAAQELLTSEASQGSQPHEATLVEVEAHVTLAQARIIAEAVLTSAKDIAQTLKSIERKIGS